MGLKFKDIKINDVLEIEAYGNILGFFVVKNKDDKHIYGFSCFENTIYKNFTWYKNEIDDFKANEKIFYKIKHKKEFIKSIFEITKWDERP